MTEDDHSGANKEEWHGDQDIPTRIKADKDIKGQEDNDRDETVHDPRAQVLTQYYSETKR